MGDITKEAMLSKLITFKEWNNSALIHLTEPTLPVIEKTKIYFVNKPNAPQSEIRVGYVAIPFDATGNYFKTSIMNKPRGQFNMPYQYEFKRKAWLYVLFTWLFFR